jgi:hypothetical protein
MTFPLEPRKRPAAATVGNEFEAKGFNPEAYSLYAHAALQVLKQAAEKASSLEPKRLAAVMRWRCKGIDANGTAYPALPFTWSASRNTGASSSTMRLRLLASHGEADDLHMFVEYPPKYSISV